MDALEAQGVTKRYRRGSSTTLALDRVDLSVPHGRRFGFLGRNGAGKTTFIKIAATLLTPTAGEVRIFGHDVMAEASQVRREIALVPQEGHPFFHLTAREHVYEYLRTRGASAESAKARTEEIVEEMGLRPHADVPAYQLSGGLQQRTLVAMILATEAPFLFLDEPTLGMDPFARRQVWKVIRTAARKGSTVLLTTHYLDEAEQLTDELAVIESGTIKYRGTPDALKARVKREIRVQFSNRFSEAELQPFGRAYKETKGVTVLTSRDRVAELTELALKRGESVAVGPVTLEEAFLELVGRAIEEEEA